jgi:anti-sigma28 factor (negative regulator of flagellin synthesis)
MSSELTTTIRHGSYAVDPAKVAEAILVRLTGV